MKIIIYSALAIVALACSVVLVIILRGPIENGTWATLAGFLAVIAAVAGAIPALRLLEIQEDVLRPRPTPYFDLTSRYNFVQLRVKNIGGGVAYDVRLRWNKHPVNDEGVEITTLDQISVLLPQQSVSTLVGVASKIVRKMGDSRFDGECWWIDASGRKDHQYFTCSVDGSKKQLVHDDEMPRTLFDLQRIPGELSRIVDRLERLRPPSEEVEAVEGGGESLAGEG